MNRRKGDPKYTIIDYLVPLEKGDGMPKKGKPLSDEEQCADKGHKWSPWIDDTASTNQQFRICQRCGKADSRKKR
jgi:hypothetical protein